jgi:hypothetical protein
MPNTVPAADTGLPTLNRRSALAKLGLGLAATSALAVTSAVAAPNAAADAELIALGAELETAWAYQKTCADADEETFEAAWSASVAIVDKIEGLRASTFEGVRVKARAIHFCLSGETILDDVFSLGIDPPTTDLRLVAGLLRDILAA